MNNFTEDVLKQNFPWDLEEVELYEFAKQLRQKNKTTPSAKLGMAILPGGHGLALSRVYVHFLFFFRWESDVTNFTSPLILLWLVEAFSEPDWSYVEINCRFNFWFFGRNPMVFTFKWNLLNRTLK